MAQSAQSLFNDSSFYISRRRKFSRTSEILIRDLNFLDPSIQPLYFHCGQICQSLKSLVILELEKRNIYELSDFKEIQEKLRVKAQETKILMLAELVRSICVRGEKEVFAAIGVDTQTVAGAFDLTQSSFDPHRSFLSMNPVQVMSSSYSPSLFALFLIPVQNNDI